ncbi:hypothetical protein Y032_0249g118 [Ancylostoma ceylanicum]|uniref:Uncharacterized protein n=1 Tax=Ancylostoma ceylanicum TaxID=53326 RepID=A0A016SD60_9BILA|nr:hypothetical protein Y032_0249g118 [Ancylostoma ceylanicum]
MTRPNKFIAVLSTAVTCSPKLAGCWDPGGEGFCNRPCSPSLQRTGIHVMIIVSGSQETTNDTAENGPIFLGRGVKVVFYPIAMCRLVAIDDIKTKKKRIRRGLNTSKVGELLPDTAFIIEIIQVKRINTTQIFPSKTRASNDYHG